AEAVEAQDLDPGGARPQRRVQTGVLAAVVAQVVDAHLLREGGIAEAEALPGRVGVLPEAVVLAHDAGAEEHADLRPVRQPRERERLVAPVAGRDPGRARIGRRRFVRPPVERGAGARDLRALLGIGDAHVEPGDGLHGLAARAADDAHGDGVALAARHHAVVAAFEVPPDLLRVRAGQRGADG